MIATQTMPAFSTRTYLADSPPLAIAVDCCHALLKGRLAFAGRMGAGKDTVARAIAGPYPVFNHADTMKAELVEWLVGAVVFGKSSLDDFSDFMGISPARIEGSLAELVTPVYETIHELIHHAADWPLLRFVEAPVGGWIEQKVALIDAYKQVARDSLQAYGEINRQLAADPSFWAQRTITRSISYRICLNADTRDDSERILLQSCGWSVLYLLIDDETQLQRRPNLTPQQRNHWTEWNIRPEDCDAIIDATRPLGSVVMQIANYLSGGK